MITRLYDGKSEALKQQALAAIESASTLQGLDEVRVAYLGKKGQITGLLKGLGKLSHEERPKAGALINVVKQQLQDNINDAKAKMEQAAINAKLAAEKIDITLPGRTEVSTGLHPVTKTIERWFE